MLVLRNLHNYLTQILSPPSIHTALLLTPEGALVSYATGKENEIRSKDEIRIVAGLSAEVWAETRGTEGEEGTVEGELGRILVLPVEVPLEDASGPSDEPLLLLALNGTTDARWEVMSSKARKLVAFLAPAVNKYRGQMQPVSSTLGPGNGGGAKSRTRSTATSPGRVAR
ncbi:hypothetical protein SCLCIDRAFT_101453 [Scleroderma citrinum Foug A]|uniref:Roadblock/LAMTOR2 domain-containing protein n=1 Tax=Scleroderma citrinum Foug A TaxID=1036808 RepID=A0A0C3AYQ5_9AGAM|nr:hypothetical protein SCLCIDRAFT_101453 [Scleroderma citrinum Foug A]